MPLGRQGAEALFKAGEHRLGQRDLGQQHQNLGGGVRAQGRGHRLKIHLRLARAGHPVEQGDLEAALSDQPIQRAAAAAAWLGFRAAPGCSGSGSGKADGVGHLHHLERAVVDQTFHNAGGDTGGGRPGRRGRMGPSAASSTRRAGGG